jgi:hypothetical protein
LSALPWYRGKDVCVYFLACVETWKALDKEGVHGLGSMAFGLGVQKVLNIETFLR